MKRVGNERVLEMVGMTRSLMVAIRRRQLRFVGHVVRKEGLEKVVLEGKINEKRQRGRRRLKYMEGLASATGCGAVELLRRAGGRAGWFQGSGSRCQSVKWHPKKRSLWNSY